MGRPQKGESGGSLSYSCFYGCREVPSWPAGHWHNLPLCVKPVESHMCCSQMRPQHQHFPGRRFCHGVACQILSRGLRPLGQQLCACEQNCLAAEKISWGCGAGGQQGRARAWGVCVRVCVLCWTKVLSPCTLYLRCFTQWETKRLCVLFKVLPADYDICPGQTQPKAVTLPPSSNPQCNLQRLEMIKDGWQDPEEKQ